MSISAASCRGANRVCSSKVLRLASLVHREPPHQNRPSRPSVLSGRASKTIKTRDWPEVLFGRNEKESLLVAGGEFGRPRSEFAGRDRGAARRGGGGREDFVSLRDRAGRLFGPAMVFELCSGRRDETRGVRAAARIARNRNQDGEQEGVCERTEAAGRRYFTVRK